MFSRNTDIPNLANYQTPPQQLSSGAEDAAAELHRMEELQNARQEMNRTKYEAV